MLRPAQTKSEKMIKVDHAGENGAVNIYRAQYITAHIRCRYLLPQLVEFQEHEKQHREIFRQHLNIIGVRRCVSYHLCGAGGFALGFITGLVGPSAIHATTYAVESVVLKHLEEQLEYLHHNDHEAYKAVYAIYADEKEHHDTAFDHMPKNNFLARALTFIVRFCTESVIKFGMR